MKLLLCFALLTFTIEGLEIRGENGSPRLETFAYPFPVSTFALTSQNQHLEMVYMDVAAARNAPPRGTVVLLHGKNFSGAYWADTARTLADTGFRVILPDQIGFGKSSKPPNYHYSLHQLAANTEALLRHAGIEQAHIVGHSMGGMLAVRFALMYPHLTRSLVLVAPLGLEDWKTKGVPHTGIDRHFDQELDQTPEKIRAYQLAHYYHGEWRPEYDRWVEMLSLFLHDENYARMAWNQALTSEMIYTQPVVYEFPQLRPNTLLIIGELDRTAPGRALAAPEQRDALGNYPALGKAAAAAIPHARFVLLEGVGHLPHIEAFPRFIEPLRSHLLEASSVTGSPSREPAGR